MHLDFALTRCSVTENKKYTLSQHLPLNIISGIKFSVKNSRADIITSRSNPDFILQTVVIFNDFVLLRSNCDFSFETWSCHVCVAHFCKSVLSDFLVILSNRRFNLASDWDIEVINWQMYSVSSFHNLEIIVSPSMYLCQNLDATALKLSQKSFDCNIYHTRGKYS